ASFGAVDSTTFDLEAADFNGDGQLDLVSGNADQANALHINRGGRRGFLSIPFETEAHDTYAIAVGDVNGDGFPDIVTANSGAVNRVYLNVEERP
ncbi:MAG: VCBS repeat-containing protein, partial [Acidobacteriota bacterium]